MNYRKYATAMSGGAMAMTLLLSQIVPAAAQTSTITLDAGTVIPVKLRDSLSSSDSQKGDRFTATLQSQESARSLHLPVGTTIEGTVLGAKPMQGNNPGVISVGFDRVVLPNESTYPIHGSLIGLDDKSVTRASNGRLVAKADQKKKTLVYAGYGAGAGLLLGALTKGNTLLDTLLGGGLGYLAGTLDKNHGDPKDVVLKPNTEMGVRLDRSVKFSAYDDGRSSSSASDNYRRTEGNGDTASSASDPNRDAYDDQTSDSQSANGTDPYQVLNQFTDIRDNGQTIRVVVAGRQLSFLPSARPFISNGVVMVPAVPVLKAAHDRYSYTSTQFTADGPAEALTAKFGSRVATGSANHRLILPAAVQRRNGTTYVPMQFLAVVTGQRLSFDRDSQTMELGGPRVTSFQH